MSDLELVPVREYFDRASADLAVSVLEAGGISAVVFGDDMGGMRPDMAVVGRIRVLVQKDKRDQATQILDQLAAAPVHPDDQPNLDDEGDDTLPPQDSAALRRAYYAAIFGSFVLPIISHVWALIILLEALPKWQTLTAVDRSRFRIALIFCVIFLVFWSYFFATIGFG